MKVFLCFCLMPCLIIIGVPVQANFDLDIDDDGKTEALTDGLLVIRHLFDFSGESLTANATGADAHRADAEAIEAFLLTNKSSLDVDGDGQVEALTDGLLIIRHLFDFSGDSLVRDAVSSNATRSSGDLVNVYLQTIKDSDNDGYVDSIDLFPKDPNSNGLGPPANGEGGSAAGGGGSTEEAMKDILSKRSGAAVAAAAAIVL